MSDTTAPRFTEQYMSDNRIVQSDNAIVDGHEGAELEYLVLIEWREGSTCACGCELPLTSEKRKFLPGHDQRLMGILVRAHRENLDVHYSSGGMLIGSTPEDYAAQVLNESGVTKLRGYLANKPKRNRSRAVEQPAVVVDQNSLPTIKVKIGRWVYDAQVTDIDQDGNPFEVEYINGKGVAVVTTKFAIAS